MRPSRAHVCDNACLKNNTNKKRLKHNHTHTKINNNNKCNKRELTPRARGAPQDATGASVA